MIQKTPAEIVLIKKACEITRDALVYAKSLVKEGVSTYDIDKSLEKFIIKCGEIYNTSTYDKPTCKKCGSPLFQRDDDNLDSIKVRLEVYEKETTPLINFYADRLFVVDGGKTADATFESVKNFLEGKK